MTYKSINTTLDELTDRTLPGGPKLVPLLPLDPDPDDSDIRDMLMPPVLLAELSKKNPKKTLNYFANVRAFLLRFVRGKLIDNETYMKSWRDDIFELRVQLRPKREAMRIFGGFAKIDTFVALVPKQRSYFGDETDARWDEIIDKTIAKWDELFPYHKRVPARPFSGCVSANFFDVYGD